MLIFIVGGIVFGMVLYGMVDLIFYGDGFMIVIVVVLIV